MLDKLFENIGGDVISQITEKAGINAEQAQQVLPLAKESFEEKISEEVTGGQLDNILGMFQGNQNSLFDGIKQQFLGKIMGQLGLPESVAGLVANTGLQSIISQVSGMIGGDGGEIDQSKLLSALGMDSGGLGDIAKNMLKDKLGGLGNLFG